MRKVFHFILICLAVQLSVFSGSADASSKALKVTAKILDSSGGKWTTEAAIAFAFADKYKTNRKYGKLCLQKGKEKPLCQSASVKPNASVTGHFSRSALKKMGLSNRKALIQAIANKKTRFFYQVGNNTYPILALWPKAKKPDLQGLIGKGLDKESQTLVQHTLTARLVHLQLTHMYAKRIDKKVHFAYLRIIKEKKTAKGPTSRSKAAKKTKAQLQREKELQRAKDWIYHLRAWTEFVPYQQMTAICSDSYTPKQALKNMNSLGTKKKSQMVRDARKILSIASRGFRLLGDSKVSGLLDAATGAIQLCQWSAFFAAAYLKYHSTNAKRAFWKEELISKKGFSLGLLTAFSYRFAQNLAEDVAKIVKMSQKVGHYSMVVAAWLLGKKYTGMTDLFCSWSYAKTLCTVAGTAVKIGKGTYSILKSGYYLGYKGVTLTVRYSKKLYYGAQGIYYYFRGLPRSGKAYCLALLRAGTFFRQEGISLPSKTWSPKICAPYTPKKAIAHKG